MEIQYSWVIAYIDINHLKNVEHDMAKDEKYEDIKVYIPTVKILKKEFKNKEHFDEVPLLFNYGFFCIPCHKAVSRIFLDELKADVSCIYAWVSDVTKVLRKKPTLHTDNIAVYSDAHIPAATATSEEIAALVTMARENTIFSSIDRDKLEVGKIVTLRGYPWDGVDAEIKEIDEKKKKVKVALLLFQQMKEVQVSFDNVFFTVYHNEGFDDSLSKHVSFDELMEKKAKTKKPGTDE